MFEPSNQNTDLGELTNNIAKGIDHDFFKMRTSFKSLRIYQLFDQILINRGVTPEVKLGEKDLEKIKLSIIEQLTTESAKYDRDIEIFYLGLICATLVHGNIPLQKEFEKFGKVEVPVEELDINE